MLSLLTLFMPFLQQQVNFFKERNLDAYYIAVEKPDFTEYEFVNLSFQDKAEKYLNEKFGFRKTLLRLRDQIYFTVFDQSPHRDYYKGKNGYLFDKRYINEYYGNNFSGESVLNSLTDDIKKLQDTLANHHIMLLTVMAPSKAFYYPEYISTNFDLTTDNPNTNYHTFCQYANDKKLNFIDFNKYFIQKKA